MEFALKPENWTTEAASLWGDMLGVNRPATFDEAEAAFKSEEFGGCFADYFREDGSYKGPCALSISVEDRDQA